MARATSASEATEVVCALDLLSADDFDLFDFLLLLFDDGAVRALLEGAFCFFFGFDCGCTNCFS